MSEEEDIMWTSKELDLTGVVGHVATHRRSDAICGTEHGEGISDTYPVLVLSQLQHTHIQSGGGQGSSERYRTYSSVEHFCVVRWSVLYFGGYCMLSSGRQGSSCGGHGCVVKVSVVWWKSAKYSAWIDSINIQNFQTAKGELPNQT